MNVDPATVARWVGEKKGVIVDPERVRIIVANLRVLSVGENVLLRGMAPAVKKAAGRVVTELGRPGNPVAVFAHGRWAPFLRFLILQASFHPCGRRLRLLEHKWPVNEVLPDRRGDLAK